MATESDRQVAEDSVQSNLVAESDKEENRNTRISMHSPELDVFYHGSNSRLILRRVCLFHPYSLSKSQVIASVPFENEKNRGRLLKLAATKSVRTVTLKSLHGNGFELRSGAELGRVCKMRCKPRLLNYMMY